MLELKNNKLRDVPPTSEKFKEAVVLYDNDLRTPVSLGTGHSAVEYGEGSYIEFINEGYYVIAILPCVPQHYTYDEEGNTNMIVENVLKYNAVIVNVVK